jgi:hypothetical protein
MSINFANVLVPVLHLGHEALIANVVTSYRQG